MYNLLIVDDEKRLREGMAAAVVEAGGFHVRTACNGKQALEMLNQEAADAMLLDVSMPDMNGIELLGILSARDQLPVTVVISGYEHFEFVREAMCCGAIDYILKPVDSEDLRKLSERLTHVIEQRNARRQNEERLQAYVQQHLREIQQKLLSDILDGCIDRSMLDDIYATYGIDLRGEKFCAAVIQLQRANHIRELAFQVALRRVELALEEMLRKKYSFSVCMFNMENARYILLMSGHNELPDAEVEALLTCALHCCAQVKEVRAYIGRGNQVNGYEQLNASYLQANHALDFKAMFGPGVVYDIRDYQRRTELSDADLLLVEMESRLRTNQFDQAEKIAREFFDLLLKNANGYSSSQLRYFIMRCRLLLPTALIRSGQDFDADILFNGMRTRGMVNEREIRASQEQTLQMLRALRPNAESFRSHQRGVAAQLREYIDKNYYDSALSVGMLSANFGYSANYMGNIFKKTYSISISDYINQRRVREAQRLISETSMHIYEVAFKVGFSDQNYFSKTFKRYTGRTPREYRDSR